MSGDFTWFAGRSRIRALPARLDDERPGAAAGMSGDRNDTPASVLIVRPSSLGDIVYALAVVSDIRREQPGAAIDWVSEPGFAPLIALCPDVRRVVPFGLRRWRRAPLDAATWRDIADFRAALRRTRYTAIL